MRFLGLVVLLPALALAGAIDTLWTRLYDGQSQNQFNMAADMQVDASRNRIYICGSGEAPQWPSVTNMLTVCYSLNGQLRWSQSYGGNTYSQDDMAHALAVDSEGNVYVAGVTYNLLPRGADISWVKYDTAGNQVWAKKTLWPYDDAAFDIALGPGGVAYIAGTAFDPVRNLSAYTILKISCATGDTLWTRRYILDTLARESKLRQRDVHPWFFQDYAEFDNCATAVAVGPDSNIVVTGFGLHRFFDLEWWTMKLRPNGDTLWRLTYRNPNTIIHDADVPFDLALAPSGDIYICGFDYNDNGIISDGYNYAVARFNSAGTLLNWRSLNIGGYDGDDYATSIVLDNANPPNVYVTGMLSYENDIICTNRFSSFLVSRWGPAGAVYGEDDAYGYKVVYQGGRVYVAGMVRDVLVTLCYTETDPVGSNKDTLWAVRYDSPDRQGGLAAAVAALDTNTVYFAGQADRSGGWTSLVLGRLDYVDRNLRVDTIYAPRGIFNRGDTATPRCRVANIGTDSAFYRVFFTVGTFYRESTSLGLLRAGETAHVAFPRWNATELGTFAARCSVATTGDPDLANNIKEATVTVVYRDVGCLRIVAPRDTVPVDTVIVPQAWVRNFGSPTQVFAARFRIGAAYNVTVNNITVPPGESLLISATPWTPPGIGQYVVSCSTMLSGDLVPANDRATATVYARQTGIDVGVTRFIAPESIVNPGDRIQPQIVIRNYGSVASQPRVFLTISDGYSDVVDPGLIQPGDSVVATFTYWFARDPEVLLATAWIGLGGDVNPRNDTLVQTVIIRYLDVAAMQIEAPVGEFDSGATVTPLVHVTNYGNTNEPFVLRMTIEAWAEKDRNGLGKKTRSQDELLYDEQVEVRLAPGRDSVVALPDWTAQRVGVMYITAWASIDGDADPRNDTTYGECTVRPAPHDVGVRRVVQPVGTIDSGAVIQPRAVVRNYTQQPEVVPVRFIIGPYYIADTTVAVAGNDSAIVTFRQWVASPVGTHPITCFTRLLGDANPANDTARAQVTVQRVIHDVGITTIIAPTGRIDSGQQVTPVAVLRNYTSFSERVPVTFLIGSSYRADTTHRLEPRAEDTIRFPRWTAGPVGTLLVTCYSALAGDADPRNDTAYNEVTVLPPQALADRPSALPGRPALEGARPTPFSQTVTISFALPTPAMVELVVFDAAGNAVRTLVSGPLPAGRHQVDWNGRDWRDRMLPEGIYYVRMISGNFSATRKLILKR